MRDRRESAEAAQRAKDRTRRAIPARRPGLERPLESQLHKPDFLAAVAKSIRTKEVADDFLAALRESGQI